MGASNQSNAERGPESGVASAASSSWVWAARAEGSRFCLRRRRETALVDEVVDESDEPESEPEIELESAARGA